MGKGWTAKPAHVVADMPYAERIAYENDRRKAMAKAGVTEAEMKLSPKAFTKMMLKRLGGA